MWKNIIRAVVLVMLGNVGALHAGGVAFDAVRAAFEDMRAGRAAPAAALAVAEDFLRQHPGDPVATAYKGSIKAHMAKDAWLPWRKLRYVNEAFELLDQAVADIDKAQRWDDRDPQLVIRLVSGSTNAQVPKTFGRRPFAERDFQSALLRPGFERLQAENRATVYAWLAVLAAGRSQERAQHYLQRAQEADAATAAAIWEQR